MIDDVVKASQTATTGGRKFDGGKLEYGLLPPYALKATVDVLTFGAQKYERDNWKKVPDSKRRYFDAFRDTFGHGKKVRYLILKRVCITWLMLCVASCFCMSMIYCIRLMKILIME